MEVDYSLHYLKRSSTDIPVTWLCARRYVRMLTPYLPRDKGARILEIGPGNGLAMKGLMDAGFTAVEGLEPDQRLATLAAEAGLNVRHLASDEIISHVAVQTGRYDLVYCMHVIEHVPVSEQPAFTGAIAEALKAGGFFVCETPNALGPMANWYRYMDWTHHTIFHPDTLEFLLEHAGLGGVRVTAAEEEVTPPRGGPVASVLKSIAQAILRFLSRGMYRIHYMAELGYLGLRVPLTPTLLAVGRKAPLDP